MYLPLAIIASLASVAGWLAWVAPGLTGATYAMLEACQSLLERCLDLSSMAAVAFLWAGGALAAGGVVYAAARAAINVLNGRAAIKRLPLADRGGIVVLIRDDRARSAFTWGLVRPRVYMTAGLIRGLTKEELRAVFFHELNHARRRDPLRYLALAFLRDAFFYIPAVCALAAHLRLKGEISADEAASRAIGEPVTVAGAILKAADANAVMASAAMAGGPGEVSARVRGLLSGERPALAISMKTALLSMAAAVAVMVSLAAPIYATPATGECSAAQCETHIDTVDGCRAHCDRRQGHAH